MREKSRSAPVGVITKVLAILELLDHAPDGLQLRDLAEKTGLNKSTVHRFASHLEAEAYLFRDESGTYTLGPKLTRMGGGVSLQATLCNISRPTIERLWKSTGETVNLAVLDGTDVLYIDVLETEHTFRLVSKVGTRRPFHCTSLGKAIVANVDDDRMKEKLFSNISFDDARTPRSITNLGRLKRELGLIQKRGFAVDEGEAVTGIRCIGAAIFGVDGKAVAALSVSGPMVRVTKDRLPFFIAELLEATQEISTRVGYRAQKPEMATPTGVKKPGSTKKVRSR